MPRIVCLCVMGQRDLKVDRRTKSHDKSLTGLRPDKLKKGKKRKKKEKIKKRKKITKFLSIIHLGLHYDGFCDCHNLHGMTPGYRHLKVPKFDIKCVTANDTTDGSP